MLGEDRLDHSTRFLLGLPPLAPSKSHLHWALQGSSQNMPLFLSLNSLSEALHGFQMRLSL